MSGFYEVVTYVSQSENTSTKRLIFYETVTEW
jgi:hypothetical protein